MLNKTPSYGIHVDVFDHRLQRRAGVDVPVVAAPRLPEMVLRLLATTNANSLQPVWRFPSQELHGFAADRFFQSLQECRRVVFPLIRHHDQVDVIGHENVCVQGIAEFATYNVDLFSEPKARAFLGKERVLLVAGKCQLVSVARFVVGFWAMDTAAMVHVWATRANGEVDIVGMLCDVAQVVSTGVSLVPRSNPGHPGDFVGWAAQAETPGLPSLRSVQPRPPESLVSTPPPKFHEEPKFLARSSTMTRPPLLTVMVWLLVSVFAPTVAVSASERPNVLIVIADDLRPELGCYGDTHVITPNLDRLAARGTVFRRAYCQKAVCWPSRNSFVSSLRPDALGRANHKPEKTFRVSHPDIVALPQLFKNHGYFTRGFGKILHNGQDDPQSWTEPAFFPDPKVYAAPENRGKLPIINRADVANRVNPLFERAIVTDEAYEDGLTAKEATATVQRVAKTEQPFLLMVGFHKPHTPFNAPARYWDLYDAKKVSLATNPFVPDGVPERYAILNWDYVRSFQEIPREGPMPDELARQVRHGYYACTSYVDALTGQLLDQLDASGAADNTIVFFWSDHGYQLGEHTIWAKHTNFELATRVPLIAFVPGRKRNGSTSEALVELVDVFPTLAELCGLPVPSHVQGRSFAGLFQDDGPDDTFRQSALSQFSRGAARGYSIRTRQYRYTEWRSLASGLVVARELYDHAVDPDENRNIAEAENQEATIERLSKMLADRVHAQRVPRVKGPDQGLHRADSQGRAAK